MKTNLFALLIALVCLCSCETEDVNRIRYEKEVAGNWELLGKEINSQGQALSECDLKNRITFALSGNFYNNSTSQNGTTFQCDANEEIVGEFSFEGNKVTINFSEGESQEGTVIVNQNLLTIKTLEDSKFVERHYKRVASPVNTITVE